MPCFCRFFPVFVQKMLLKDVICEPDNAYRVLRIKVIFQSVRVGECVYLHATQF